MAASSLPPSYSINLHFSRHKQLTVFKYPKIRSQSFDEDGTSANIVDGNLGVLRERIAEARVKERLESCCGSFGRGWNYQPGYDYKRKRSVLMSESLELIGFIGGALGLVFVCGSLSIFLVSLLVHMSELMNLYLG